MFRQELWNKDLSKQNKKSAFQEEGRSQMDLKISEEEVD